PSHDGCCRVFCGESFLGDCAFAGRAKPTDEGGNATHLFHIAGLLLLLSRPTGRCGGEGAAMGRSWCHWRWFGLGLALHSSPSGLECTCLVSCWKNGAEPQAVSIQLQTIFSRDVSHCCCSKYGHSLTGKLHCHRALAST